MVAKSHLSSYDQDAIQMSTTVKVMIGLAVAVVTVMVFFLIFRNNIMESAPSPSPNPGQVSPSPSSVSGGSDPRNTTYLIENKPVTLVDGKTEEPAAPGSAQMVTTTLFDAPTMGDLSGDGVDDAGVILVVATGGSGTFYYAAAALQQSQTYTGTNAILLGDRIAPQTKTIADQIYTVNYADRKEGEAMSAQPTVGVSKSFKVSQGSLIEAD